jgi:hypothetical protein
MKRMKVLLGKRRVMVIATLAILVLAAAALVASSASFTASSANVTNTFTTGNLTMSNGVINFNSGKLMPNHSLTGTVDLTATADGGTASLYLKRTAHTGDATLAGKLTLTITETTLGTVYATKTLDAADLENGNGVEVATVPDAAAGTSYHFVFTVNFPDGGTSGADNAFRNLSTGTTYVFTAISD